MLKVITKDYISKFPGKPPKLLSAISILHIHKIK